jgi:S-(hydroxymethyl)glutathione dehydrogenase/alcohol dehydrogenase
MRAAVLREFGRPLLIEEVAVEEPQYGEVMVRIAASGICGSDVHAWHGRSNATPNLPIVLGHEGAGVVEMVGAGITDLKRGDHVVVSMSGPCGQCGYCGTSRPQYCDGAGPGSIFGIMEDGRTRFSQGGETVYPFVGIGSLGEYAVVRRARLIKVDPEISFDRLCITACGVVTGVGAVLNVARVTPGSSVLVVGCGGVGLNVIQAARLAGAGDIIAVDANPAKLDLAADFGASHCITASSKPGEIEAAVKRIAPKGVDFAFDVVGDLDLIGRLMALTDLGGLTVMVGVVPWSSQVSVSAGLMLMGERRLTGVRGGSTVPTRDIPRILNLYRNGRLKLDELVGAAFPLDEVAAAFAEAERARHARTVVHVTPSLL